MAELGDGLTDVQWDTPTCLPGWTVKDALVHMGGTEAMLLGEPGRACRPAGHSYER